MQDVRHLRVLHASSSCIRLAWSCSACCQCKLSHAAIVPARVQPASRGPRHAGCSGGCALRAEHELRALQAHLLACAQESFKCAPGRGLRGDLLAGAALQLLPLALAGRITAPRPAGRLAYHALTLLRLTCRAAASLHFISCWSRSCSACGVTLCGCSDAPGPPGRDGGRDAHCSRLRWPGRIRGRHSAGHDHDW